ncbi:MAG: metallophosphoesterase family protein [Acidilobaceae archaeon]
MISDVHGNYDALRAVLEASPPHDDVWILGDLVDYGPEPDAVVDEVRSLKPGVAVRGNHDHAAAYGVDCGCGDEVRWLSVYTREAVTARLLDEGHRAWLRSLRIVEKREAGRFQVTVVHGSPSNPLYGYLKPGMSLEELRASLAQRPGLRLRGGSVEPVSGLFAVGHAHVAYELRVDEARVLNPGSVGQPRDGDPRASFGVLDLETGRFEIRRVEYDVARVVSKLRALGLREDALEKLASILLTGRA